jgi:hypothetical protein
VWLLEQTKWTSQTEGKTHKERICLRKEDRRVEMQRRKCRWGLPSFHFLPIRSVCL